MKDRLTLIIGLVLIGTSPIMFLYVMTFPDIPCEKWPIDSKTDCSKWTPEEFHKISQQGKLGAAIFVTCFMWPYGVYYLYKRNKELKTLDNKGV